MPRQVLFLYNDPSAPEALMGEVFAESGFDIDTFEVVPAHRAEDPALDVTFPDPLDYDAIVPLGARWAVYDDRLADRWVAGEIAMVQRALSAGLGVLGVCFGGQLLARALGGTVASSPLPEVGWHEVSSSRPDLAPGGTWFQWHFDRLTAPPGAIEIARSERATQAFVSGRALGLQFHPEVDAALVERWIDEDGGADLARVGLDPDDLRAETAAHLDDAARRLRLLVSGFAGLLEDRGV
ncbi:MAG: type 1 glutamine amidotransferase [Mycobacterium sp.]|nr:type 1 glutamine amidotransferase [Mycobacterium sp.]